MKYKLTHKKLSLVVHAFTVKALLKKLLRLNSENID